MDGPGGPGDQSDPCADVEPGDPFCSGYDPDNMYTDPCADVEPGDPFCSGFDMDNMDMNYTNSTNGTNATDMEWWDMDPDMDMMDLDGVDTTGGEAAAGIEITAAAGN